MGNGNLNRRAAARIFEDNTGSKQGHIRKLSAGRYGEIQVGIESRNRAVRYKKRTEHCVQGMCFKLQRKLI